MLLSVRAPLLFFVLLCGYAASCQQYYHRDSLWMRLRTSQADTNMVSLYIQLGQQYENNNPDSAIWLYEQALKLSKQLNYERGIISYYTNVTYVYNLQGKYDTALALNLRSVEIARNFGDTERLAACLGNVGASYMSLALHELAIDYFFQAAELYEELQDESRLSVLYSNLCILYRNINQYEKALGYGQRSLRLARELKNVYSTTSTLVNLAVVHTELAQYKESITLLMEARELARQTNNEYALLVSALNLTDVYINLADFLLVKKYCTEALALATRLGDTESETIALRGMSIYYFSQNESRTAEQYALRSLNKAITNNHISHIGKIYQVLSDIAILDRQFTRHNQFRFKSDSIEQLLLNATVGKNIQELEVKYQAKQKEQQILQLEQQALIKDLSLTRSRLLILSLAIIIMAILVIVWLVRRSFIQKREILLQENALNQSRILQLENEQKLMASEAVIKGQEEERGRLARDLHDGLGGLLSGVKFSLANMKTNVVLDADTALVFERSLDMLDHSIFELRRVAHNMMPEVLVKFGLSEAVKSYCDSLQQAQLFNITFQVLGERLRFAPNTEIIMYRIIQELLNNIVKHASAKNVLVQLSSQGQELTITVEDDGVGFHETAIAQSSGDGWANIRSRVEYLKGKIDIQSSSEKGTSVHIMITIP